MNYLNNAARGALVFLLVCYATFPIYAILQYRRRGTVSLPNAVIRYSFILYMITAYFMVIFPLPSISSVANSAGARANFRLFQFVGTFIQKSGFVPTRPDTWPDALKSSAFYTVAFNILLTFPFGVYARRYFNFNFRRTLLFSIGLTLFYELSQLTGLFGIYPKPYRIFDVDDLMINTLGAMLGYATVPLMRGVLPKPEGAPPAVDAFRPVPYLRRALSYMADMLVFEGLLSASTALMGILNLRTPAAELLWSALLMGLYFIGLNFILNGRTPGKMLLKMRVVSTRPGKYLSLGQLAVRYGLWMAAYQAYRLAEVFDAGAGGAGQALWIIALAGVTALAYLHLFWRMILKKRTLFYEDLSATKEIPS